VRNLLVGRFQPFHKGHLAVVEGVRSGRPEEELILGIGSAQASYTRDNPFTAGERFEMIRRVLEEAKISGVYAVPLVDVERHAVWVAHVASLLPPFDRVYTNNPLTRLLFESAGYAVEMPQLVDRGRLQGIVIRRQMVAGEDWRPSVPSSAAKYLEDIGGPERLRLLAQDRPVDAGVPPA
jgi:nicotinamide-nucleotide adenylyltransferase